MNGEAFLRARTILRPRFYTRGSLESHRTGDMPARVSPATGGPVFYGTQFLPDRCRMLSRSKRARKCLSRPATLLAPANDDFDCGDFCGDSGCKSVSPRISR